MIEKATLIKYPENTFTIDPGDNTGWAYWNGTDKPISGSFTFPNGIKDRTEQISALAYTFHKLILVTLTSGKKIEEIVIEEVALWEGSLNSMTSAKRGTLFKLAYTVGAYIDRAGMNNIPVKLVKPQSWKGQLDDEAVLLRVQLITGIECSNFHQSSAIGIGLNEAGIFKDFKIIGGHLL